MIAQVYCYVARLFVPLSIQVFTQLSNTDWYRTKLWWWHNYCIIFNSPSACSIIWWLPCPYVPALYLNAYSRQCPNSLHPFTLLHTWCPVQPFPCTCLSHGNVLIRSMCLPHSILGVQNCFVIAEKFCVQRERCMHKVHGTHLLRSWNDRPVCVLRCHFHKQFQSDSY